jgi:hypothetical protein
MPSPFGSSILKNNTILEHSRTLIDGLVAKMLALNILRNFAGLKALFAPAVQKKLTSRP